MSKYGARRTDLDGHTFASRREAQRYQEIRLMEHAFGVDQITNLRCQVAFRLEVHGHLICKYIADFTYTEWDGTKRVLIVEDCKGVKTPIYRLKAKLMLAIHGIRIRES